jgi:hypothetical protein
MQPFAVQSDPFALMEKAAVRHACAVSDLFVVDQRISLDALAAVRPGEMVRQSDLCPVGTVEFCRAWMRATGVAEPYPVDYPEPLKFALGRHLIQVPFAQALVGSWIKPVRTKAWEPYVLSGGENRTRDEVVWECAPIPREQWIAEWRVYVVDGQIIGHGRYDDGPDDAAVFDALAVQAWVQIYGASGTAPAGYALDVALLSDGCTVLVEVTDGWGIGIYKGTCGPVSYTKLLAVRWAEIAKRSSANG